MTQDELETKLQEFLDSLGEKHVQEFGKTVSNQYKEIFEKLTDLEKKIVQMDIRYFSVAVLLSLVFALILIGKIYEILI